MSSSPVEYSIIPSPPAQSPADPYRERQPPWSEEAEEAVVAAMLMDTDAIYRAAEIVNDAMFYRPAHRRIFRAMITLNERGAVVDPLTLSEELARQGDLKESGGKEYIGYLVDRVPTSANIEHHARIVRDKAILRRLIEAGTSIVGEAFAGRHETADLLDDAERRIFEISQDQGGQEFVRLKELLWPAMEHIEALQRRDDKLTGVPSGFNDLDSMTLGFQPGDLVIIAARPSMGKTAFVLNIAQHSAIERKAKVAFFSIEMSKESLVQRLLASEALVDSQGMRRPKGLRDDEIARLARAAGVLVNAPIYIDDSASLSVLEMRSKARRLKADLGLDLVIVDYLQLVSATTSFENRVQEISHISRSLKALAKELQVPVLALSQLSRAPEQRSGTDNGRPQLSDLRDSGAIEQDADVVLGIYRPEQYAERDERGQPRDKDGNSVEGQAEILVLKQRNGPTGVVKLHFDKQYTRFRNLAQRPEPDIGGSRD
jgi:replicative DNA helicase